jgi:nucleoside phosphorylase
MMTATKTPLLLCAATKWELAPLAGLRSADVALLKTGIGPDSARAALAAVTDARMIVSTGFAGALQSGMASGDLVLDIQGLDAELPPLAREIALRQKTPIHFGRIIHSDEVLCRPEQKLALGKAERAAAVDMESQALRQAAERLGVPFLAARVILDSVNDRLPSSVPSGEKLGDLVSYVIANWKELPVMMRAASLQRRAGARLAAFLSELLPKL